jgi:ribosomal protein S12 methylthiotransferase accessory factor
MHDNAKPMETVIDVDFPGGRRVNALVNGHVAATDQKSDLGGDDSAPRPFELFLASIAACAGAYAAGYCQRKSLPADGLALRLRCASDPAGRRVERMTFELTAPPGLNAKQIKALERVVMNSAVKKHMENAPEFAIETRRTEASQPEV